MSGIDSLLTFLRSATQEIEKPISFPAERERRKHIILKDKNTIRDSRGNTALYVAQSVDTVDTVDTVDMVYTIDMTYNE